MSNQKTKSGTYKDITYTLKKSDRKTASIYIERDGTVSVLVPRTLKKPGIERLVETKRKWIYQNLAQWEDMNSTRTRRQFVSGEGFMYLGRSYRLKLVADQAEAPAASRMGTFCLLSEDGQLQNPDAAFKEFYKAKGQKKVPGTGQFLRGTHGRQTGGSTDPRTEESLGVLHTGRKAELPLEVYDGPINDYRLHRRA